MHACMRVYVRAGCSRPGGRLGDRGRVYKKVYCTLVAPDLGLVYLNWVCVVEMTTRYICVAFRVYRCYVYLFSLV